MPVTSWVEQVFEAPAKLVESASETLADVDDTVN